jgi:hypothetical protein
VDLTPSGLGYVVTQPRVYHDDSQSGRLGAAAAY